MRLLRKVEFRILAPQNGKFYLDSTLHFAAEQFGQPAGMAGFVAGKIFIELQPFSAGVPGKVKDGDAPLVAVE